MHHALNRSTRRWTLPLAAVTLTGAVGLAAAAVGPAAGGVEPQANQPEQARTARQAPQAKNVILFVGDGMGAAARTAGQLTSKGLDGSLVMDTLPVSGLVHTDSADPETFVTDSAAAATALATGVKTYNGAIGLDLDGNRVQTLIEQAERAGKSTGIVTTAQVTDATGAGFAAHVADRYEQSEIARQYIEKTGVDVLLGGGEDYWYPEGNEGAFPDAPAEDPEEGSRSDKGNLVRRAKDLGYTYVHNGQGLRAAHGAKLLGLFANEEMFQQRAEGDGAIYDPVVSLERMTRKAVRMLSADKDGFFLIVEEEATDEMAHANNAPLTMKGVHKLDQAVRFGKAFTARRHDTLLITTADHETGGLTVEDTSDEDESGAGQSAEDGPFAIVGSDLEFRVDWTTTGHTDADVPLTAMGPGARRLVGVYENTYVHDAIEKALFR